MSLIIFSGKFVEVENELAIMCIQIGSVWKIEAFKKIIASSYAGDESKTNAFTAHHLKDILIIARAPVSLLIGMFCSSILIHSKLFCENVCPPSFLFVFALFSFLLFTH